MDQMECNWEPSVGALCVVRYTDNWEPSVGALCVVRYTDNWEPSVGALCVVRYTDNLEPSVGALCVVKYTDNWEPGVGALCVVRYTDVRLYRARVLVTNADTVSVFFIDYDNTTCIERTLIYPSKSEWNVPSSYAI